VRRLLIARGAMSGVEFDNLRIETADAYILALPHSILGGILPEEVRESHPPFANLRNLKDAPITGVHFWFDRMVMDEPFLTLLDTETQWIFNKTMLYGGAKQPSGDGRASGEEKPLAVQYLQMVISASYELVTKSRQEIIDICLREVRQALPKAREAQLVKATVIKETAATFSPEPGVDRWRALQTSPIKGLFLAGDWTATGWPATMEGAVRSGYLAAEAVLRNSGRPQKFLQDDLAPDGLMKFWARSGG
jgi:uncharacterized protein with NAD-binding domain and iron-sulfur cluster